MVDNIGEFCALVVISNLPVIFLMARKIYAMKRIIKLQKQLLEQRKIIMDLQEELGGIMYSSDEMQTTSTEDANKSETINVTENEARNIEL